MGGGTGMDVTKTVSRMQPRLSHGCKSQNSLSFDFGKVLGGSIYLPCNLTSIAGWSLEYKFASALAKQDAISRQPYVAALCDEERPGHPRVCKP